MKLRLLTAALLCALAANSASALSRIPLNSKIEWDSISIIADGQRVIPVMGEIHYSRIPADEWADEIAKMKDGGITLIATYCFWNHHEEDENVFDWSGQRDLRRFLEECKAQDMPVILRMGPFCHGEARNGGIPDWVFTKGCRMREANPQFLSYVTRLYRQIFTQMQGLQWADGGPVIAVQFDNEYRGHGAYLMALKKIANDIGIDLPFYTRTGWPELRTPVPFGEMLPLYGDYADGFWERSIKPSDGNYYKAFNFNAFRKSTAIATEQLGKQDEKTSETELLYPYFTCELGSGMATAYHRRPYIYPEDTYSLTIVKLGSGSNLPGYYMYHGGTNPYGKHSYLNENQGTQATNYNDMPVLSYDFQAPLNECGFRNPQYYQLRVLHNFLADYGSTLAPMTAYFPAPQGIAKGADDELRWSYRALGDSAFVFVNNYERLQNLSAKPKTQFEVAGVKFPSRPITIPAGAMCIFPVNISGMKYATAQIVANRDGKVYMMQIPGIDTEIAIDGKVLKKLKPKGIDTPVYGNIYLLTPEDASHLFQQIPNDIATEPLTFTKVKDAQGNREIKIGVQKVAVEPDDADFENAAVYHILLPTDRQNSMIEIDYRGDCARIYADGKLINDNFYYGRTMQYPLWRLPADCSTLELRILPIQPDMPIYFSEEADITPGESIVKVSKVTFRQPMK